MAGEESKPHRPWFSQEELGRFAEFLTGDSARDQRNFMTLLATVTEVLGEPDFDELLNKLVDHAIMTTRAERGMLLLLGGGGGGELEIRVARDKKHEMLDDPNPSRTICKMVLERDRPVFERVSDELEGRSISQSVAAMRLRQVMCAPLRARGKMLGVIYVDSTLSGPAPKPADLILFHAQAGLMGMAIQNHRLLQETIAAQETDSQLQIARAIQIQLLPDSPTMFGKMEAAGYSEPSSRVGGDCFDYFAVDGGRLGLSVSDVSGHGIGPALIMSNVRAHLRSLLFTRRSLGGLYGMMNRALCEDLSDGMFVSLFVALYDPKSGLLEFQNAGHVAPLLYNPEKDTFRSILANAPALGLIDEMSAGPCPSVRVEPGEFLVCFTDGVTEMHNRDDVLFGEERIQAAIRRAVKAGGGPHDVVKAICEDIEAHAEGLPPRDDVTLVATRF